MISRFTHHLFGSSISHHLLSAGFFKNMQDEGSSGFVLHGVVCFWSEGVYGGAGLRHHYPSPNGTHPQVLGESLVRSSPPSSERGMTASSPWIWTRGTSG